MLKLIAETRPTEFVQLPRALQQAMLEASAEDAAEEYRTNSELTEFTRAHEGVDFVDG